MAHSILSCRQNCVKTHLYKQYYKWFEILPASFATTPPHVGVNVQVQNTDHVNSDV